jgi:hypothetical protein
MSDDLKRAHEAFGAECDKFGEQLTALTAELEETRKSGRKWQEMAERRHPDVAKLTAELAEKDKTILKLADAIEEKLKLWPRNGADECDILRNALKRCDEYMGREGIGRKSSIVLHVKAAIEYKEPEGICNCTPNWPLDDCLIHGKPPEVCPWCGHTAEEGCCEGCDATQFVCTHPKGSLKG